MLDIYGVSVGLKLRLAWFPCQTVSHLLELSACFIMLAFFGLNMLAASLWYPSFQYIYRIPWSLRRASLAQGCL